MENSGIRVALLILDAFVAITAIGGGVALATGLEGERFPVEWLRRTSFRSYLGPGLILAIAVGGSACVAAVLTWRIPEIGAWASIVAGIILTGQILGELLLLDQPKRPTTTEVAYLVIAAAMLVMSILSLTTP